MAAPWLIGLTELDKKISSSLCLAATKESPLGYLRPQMKFLEYSCHGVFWISFSLVMLWFTEDPPRETFFFNVLLLLAADIVFVAVLKCLLRRQRPESNSKDMFLTISIDQMSCPSGHSSRAVLFTLLFLALLSPNSWLIWRLLLCTWCLLTCLSRVMMGRHYAGDVLAGIVLGYIEYAIILPCVWLDQDSVMWCLSFFRDSGSIIDEL